MTGRIEHEQRTIKNIEQILKDMPEYVIDFYYAIRISKEPKTCLEYLRKIRHFLNFVNKDILEVTEKDISRYFDHIYYTKVNHEIKKTSSAYRQLVWTTLNQFFIYLYKHNIVKTNSIELIKRPKYTDYVEKSILSMEEVNLILSKIKEGAGTKKAKSRQKEWVERDLLIMTLFIYTGMRETALSEIDITDISFITKELVVIDKRNVIQKYCINENIKIVIENWLEKREQLLGEEQTPALFISSKRKRISEKAISNIVKKYSEAALGRIITPHELRGTFISLSYEALGYDIKAVSEAVGHSNIATTSRYIRKKNNSREEALSFMSNNLQL